MHCDLIRQLRAEKGLPPKRGLETPLKYFDEDMTDDEALHVYSQILCSEEYTQEQKDEAAEEFLAHIRLFTDNTSLFSEAGWMT